MKAIGAIAFNTFKEAVRNRILYIILLFALILIGASGALSQLTIAARDKIIKDLGFTSINLFGIAIAVFVGVSLVYNELEKKTIYTIVSKPISRWQFLLGKFLGLLLTIYVNLLIMTVFFLFMLHYEFSPPTEQGWFSHVGACLVRTGVNLFAWNNYEATAHIMPVIGGTMVEIAVITSFAILFSSFSTPTLSMFFTVLTFIAGRMNEDIMLFAENVRKTAMESGTELPLSYFFALWSARITPNLGIFHQSVEQALYEDSVNLPQNALIYALCYTAGVLCLSMLIFSRRNFK